MSGTHEVQYISHWLANKHLHAFAAICMQIMELIVDKKGSNLDAFGKVRAELDQMRIQPGQKHASPPQAHDGKRPRLD
jgi:hypothetical protein